MRTSTKLVLGFLLLWLGLCKKHKNFNKKYLEEMHDYRWFKKHHYIRDTKKFKSSTLETNIIINGLKNIITSCFRGIKNNQLKDVSKMVMNLKISKKQLMTKTVLCNFLFL